jgi:PAS domain S-box-containing protein
MAEPRERSRYAEIFEHAPVARLITDGVGTIQDANRSAAQLLQVLPSLLAGKPLVSFVPDEARRDFRRLLLRATGSTTPMTWLLWLQAAGEETPFPAEVHVVASRTDTGHLHWAITDVTPRMAMERELRLLTAELEERVRERTRELEAERARLAAVIDQTPVGLTIVNAEGKVLIANAEAHRLLGDHLDSEITEGRAELVREDGSRLALEVTVAPIVGAEGEPIGSVRVFQDVSQRERQERAEREFVSNAAHQLQSPLAGIISAVEVLQAGAKGGPERDRFLGHIERESNRLARLSRALLILARAQTGVEAPKDEVVAIGPLLSDIAASVRPVDGVSVVVSCPPDLAVVTNRELVEQAVVNVVENAVKYTVDGRITLAARAFDGAAEIVVSDSGPGIPTPERARVVERFYRGRSNGSDGFGLGLALVRSAVQALDGDLELGEHSGGGTAVTLRLRPAASLVDAR